MDAQAGLEPFGRTVAEGFGTTLVVSEPTFNSLQVAARIEKLSRGLGMRRVDLVLNKCRGKDDLKKVGRYIQEAAFDLVHELPLDPEVLEHEPDVSRIASSRSPYMESVRKLFRTLDG